MLAAIQFHYQFTLDAGKINNVRAHGMLPSKFMAIELPLT